MFKKSNDKKSQTTRESLLFLSLQQTKIVKPQFKAASIVNEAYFVEQ